MQSIAKHNLEANDPRGFNYRRSLHQYLHTGLQEGQQLTTSPLPFSQEAGDLVLDVRTDQALKVSIEVRTGETWAPVDRYELASGAHELARYTLPVGANALRMVLNARRACKAVSVFTQFRTAEA